MSPPPGPRHAHFQSKIGTFLERLLPEGGQLGECAVSTSDGIKGVDVAWLAPDRRHELSGEEPVLRAPDTCVEILSPSNTVREIQDKIDLYFEAGAREVWVCDRQGRLNFHVGSRSNRRPSGTSPCRSDPTSAAHRRSGCQSLSIAAEGKQPQAVETNQHRAALMTDYTEGQ